MKNSVKLFLIVSAILSQGYAQNPIVPPGMYIADPSAHVWNDGKLYLYGSLDESPDYYCSHRHHVLSTADLKSIMIGACTPVLRHPPKGVTVCSDSGYRNLIFSKIMV
jgi:hypothetical protein